MIDMIGKICKKSLHYRHGYIELMKRIIEGYQCTDIFNISFLSQYDDIKINTPEYAIMNDNEDELLYHLKSKRLDLTKILEKCCLRGAVNCFKLLQKEFHVKITKKCLDASLKGNNQHIINECLKENEPDQYTVEAVIASHNFANFYKLITEYDVRIRAKNCAEYKNLHAFIYILIEDNFNLDFLIAPSFHIPSLCEYFMQYVTDIDYADEKGVTALIYSCFHYSTDVAEFLISRGANINKKDSTGHTPIHFAIISYWDDHDDLSLYNSKVKDLVELLLSNGANVNAKDKDGHTPLHLASLFGTKEIAEILVSHGAKINVLDATRATPLDLTIQREKYKYKINSKPETEYQEAKKIQALLKLHGGITKHMNK
ncbi:hypothetical protein TVAG_246650 [Trichomonas vaginalis G3]|uniref:DUF3447 domain-containing protein n=1 Tax=Trichomonas vaginalis (strain ATCC PRA-98 / G3) TaxID=412133 RepID=A2DKK4_TRIV3|nr:protein ubiquitination [Trichomonas vaginalis G3]EAY18987.1 hypothetical protein TVAG_246650 [Trichomonas vaginalis G3]KAI5521220.1 protein ubiquitination [Trichomonas vaginalis G3]|eukprot:XP_001579973.1 hypothetical protein [Trichomonas vaginalis G3]